MKRFLAYGRLAFLGLALALIFQPVFLVVINTPPAQAIADPASEASQGVGEESSDTVLNSMINTWNDLSWQTSTAASNSQLGAIKLSVDDQNELRNCNDPEKIKDCKVDKRVISYLTYLVTPVEQGGAGLPYLKANNILHGYDTNGIGKYDRETLDASTEDPSLLSAHTSGQAVDISEVGQITCKLVEKHHVGGDKTSWQAPRPIKVAWQSQDGINNTPTPTGNSLVGIAGNMSAESILQYLNSSGEMDAYVDYAKGLDFATIIQYVGANIFLKTYGSGQITQDPLAGSLLQSLGSQILKKQLPGVPDGVSSANPQEDARTAIGTARLEQDLTLPAGSLHNLGWDSILTNTGKRAVEQALGLPSLYLDNHSLNDLNATSSAQGGLGYAKQSDSALNFPSGTVDTLKKGDSNGLKMAAVNLIAEAFHFTDSQRQALLDAVKASHAPDISLDNLPVTNLISTDGLIGLFSNDLASQNKALDELKQKGMVLLQQAAARSVPASYAGLTRQILSNLLNPGYHYNLKDLMNDIGSSQLIAQTGITNSRGSGVAAVTQASNSIAQAINRDLGLTGSSGLTSADITAMISQGNFSAVQKIGAAQADKAIGWNSGSAYDIITGKKKFDQAIEEVFANSLGAMLGLPKDGFSLNGDTLKIYAAKLLEQRLGLPTGTITETATMESIAQAIGDQKFRQIFGINPHPSSDELGNPVVNQKLENLDLVLGLPKGSVKDLLLNKTDVWSLAKNAVDANFKTLTPQKIWDYFNLDSVFQLPTNGQSILTNPDLAGGGAINIFDTISHWDSATDQNKDLVLYVAQKIVGRYVDSQTNFTIDGFLAYFSAPDDATRSKILIDQGTTLLMKALGSSISGVSASDLEDAARQLREYFNDPSSFGQGRLQDFFFKAIGLPAEFRNDANAFLTGDYKRGLEEMSFVLWTKNINPYLPSDDALTYAQMRETIIFDDQSAINARADKIIKDGGYDVSPSERIAFEHEARQQLMEEAKKNAEYKISDSFLRKIDPTVPAGFSRIMFSGSDQERAALLQGWIFNHIDSILQNADPSYQPGTVEALYNGTADQRQTVIIQEIVRRTGLTLGPLNTGDFITYISFIGSSNRGNFYTDPKYASMWTSLNSWISQTTGIGDLPPTAAQSIYLASQSGWDFNKEVKDANGNIVVPSLNSLGQNFLESQLSQWGDKQLNVPAGTMYKAYQAIKSVVDASKALEAAKAAGDASQYATASNNLSKAQASLAVFVITMALNYCAACQQFFASVDAAIQAPPGFTNAVVAGAVAMAFGLGPAGLYIAAAIYLFGTYRVDYLCPSPPKEAYAITSYDKDYDRIDEVGIDYAALGRKIQPNPSPGTDPFKWGDTQTFNSGNSPKLWEAWSRYFTGLLLDKTLAYGEMNQNINKPLQVITFRQANVEYFADRATAAFGDEEKDNPKIGLGFSQGSTNTTDWVHVTFGGYF